MFGESDNDFIWGELGRDLIRGGAGNDALNGGAENDTILGESGNDLIYGDNNANQTGNDALNGGAGNDIIYGGNGNDTITGEAGADTMFGHDGADTFIYNNISESIKASYDNIYFQSGIDKLIFKGLGFTSLDTDGGLTETGELRFAAGSDLTSDQLDFYIDFVSGGTPLRNDIIFA